MRVHYPRTPHLPWSPGATRDDLRAAGLTGLTGREVVVTEKLDGENTTLYADGLHARSLDSAHHPSRTWIKALHGRVRRLIPDGWRVCGENLYARHSLAYTDLDGYFYAFSVWDGDRCLDWDATVRFARRLGVPVPRVLWRGVFDEKALRRLRVDPERDEGYVVRAAEGFAYGEFASRVAKWVRTGHVQTGTHWMHAEVVANGLGPAAALWDVRSGAAPDPAALRAALGEPEDGTDAAAADVATGLDLVECTGDDRLAGVLAALLHRQHRTRLALCLAAPLGVPTARRVADLVGLAGLLHRPFPDAERPVGLRRLARAVDLYVLHMVAALTAGDEEQGVQVQWSLLHAEEAGLLDEAPPAPPRWRPPDAPRLIVLCGPSGSGKSRFAAGLSDVDEIVSMDDLREARGSRADQRANPEVHRRALARLDAALAPGRTVVWDATSLNAHQRGSVHAVAARRRAHVTHAVFLVDPELLAARNKAREHAVHDLAMAVQLCRFAPPYPGEADRTWYIDADGVIADSAGEP